MKTRKILRCSKSVKTSSQLNAELAAYREILYQRIAEGWRAYFITIQLPETNLSGFPLHRKIKTGAEMFMRIVTSRFSGEADSDLDLSPIAIFGLDRRDGKSNKIEPTIHPANESLHLHGIVLIHPKARRKKLKNDVRENRWKYEHGKSLKIHVVRIKKNPGKVLQYALKAYAKRHFDTEEIMVFPLSRSELSESRDTTSSLSNGTMKNVEFVGETMSALRSLSEKAIKGEVAIKRFLSMTYVAARGLDERFGIKAGILVKKWLLNNRQSGFSVPRYSRPTYAVVLGAASVERKTRSKYKQALDEMVALFGSSLPREEFEDKLALRGGISGVVVAKRKRKASGKQQSKEVSAVSVPIAMDSRPKISVLNQLRKEQLRLRLIG